MEKWFSLVIGFFCLSGAIAQNIFWSDTFEDTGAPSSGLRNPEIESGAGGPPYADYFIRAANADLNLHALIGVYSGFEGLRFWAGEDHDNIDGADGTPPDAELQIDWTGIDISGKTNLQFIGRFAANPGNFWDHSNPSTDYVIVESSIDGGPWNTIIAFYGIQAMIPGPLREDTDGDTFGDGNALSGAFQEFTRNIAGTGNTLALRLRAFSDNGSTEEWAVDHFRLAQTAVLPVELAAFKVSWQAATQTATLEWKTWSEKNNRGFAVERLRHNGPWMEIGFVPGQGDAYNPQNYRFTDKELSTPGLYHYRLRQMDFDGAETWSGIRSIHVAPATPKPEIYPNPARETLFFSFPLNGPYRVVGPTGKTCLQGIFRDSENLDLTGLASGVYALQLETGAEMQALTFIVY